MSTPKRLAFVLPDLGGGGAERVALTLMRAFLARGFTIDLVLVKAAGELLAQVPPEVTVIDLGAGRYAKALWPLVRYLRRSRPHAIQVRMWPLTVIAILARLLARVSTRVVTSDHVPLSVMYADNPRAIRAIRWTTRLLYPIADARVFVSGGSADDLVRLTGLRRDSFDIIYNPIPSAAAAAPQAEIEMLWGDAEDRILTVGTLKPVKNHALLIDAFALLRQQRPRARLMILGDGILLDALRGQALRLDIGDAVSFPGFVTDPAPYYGSANLFVLASNYEGFGNVLVEAMRQGTSVVSTDCETGPREILASGRYGILTPCGNAAALADAMAAALAAPLDPAILRARAERLSGIDTVDRYQALLVGQVHPSR